MTSRMADVSGPVFFQDRSLNCRSRSMNRPSERDATRLRRIAGSGRRFCHWFTGWPGEQTGCATASQRSGRRRPGLSGGVSSAMMMTASGPLRGLLPAMPVARRLMSKLVQVAGKGRAELRNPLPDRFVRDVEPPLG